MGKKTLKIKIVPSINRKSSEEIVQELVKQTVTKVLKERKRGA